MAIMTYVDVLRVQDFVLVSNRLRDVVAGSDLVVEATRGLVETVARPCGGTVVFAAGGNALLVFEGQDPRDRDQARRFAANYSRQLLEDYPGLEVEMVHREYESGKWLPTFLQVQQELQRRKLARVPHAAVAGLSVTAECAETGGVATHLVSRPGSDGRVPASSTVWRRRRQGRNDTRWETLLPSQTWNDYQLIFPGELDQFRRTSDDTSLMAVVHVDGNQVGRRIAEWLRSQDDADDKAVREQQQRLSERIEGLGIKVMGAVLARVYAALAPWKEHGDVGIHSAHPLGGFPLHTDGRKLYLPIRPVLAGGDDLTFLCDGRIGLSLARTALETLHGTPVPEFNSAVGACAGVAIVKTHAPFSRAYRMAKALCARAKAAIVESDTAPQYFLDWHIGYASPMESVNDLRMREYQVGKRTLTMRPYALGSDAVPHTFVWLDEVVLGRGGAGDSGGGFQNDWWQQRRGKIKRLLELVREGPDAVAAAVDGWKVTVGLTPVPAYLESGGYTGPVTPIVDAIELLDVHHPLAGGTP